MEGAEFFFKVSKTGLVTALPCTQYPREWVPVWVGHMLRHPQPWGGGGWGSCRPPTPVAEVLPWWYAQPPLCPQTLRKGTSAGPPPVPLPPRGKARLWGSNVGSKLHPGQGLPGC